MRWIPQNDYYIESSDKRFRISKSFVGESTLYTLWENKGNTWENLLITNSARAAKQRADDSPNAKND